jgi:hypothetical protein
MTTEQYSDSQLFSCQTKPFQRSEQGHHNTRRTDSCASVPCTYEETATKRGVTSRCEVLCRESQACAKLTILVQEPAVAFGCCRTRMRISTPCSDWRIKPLPKIMLVRVLRRTERSTVPSSPPDEIEGCLLL